MVDLAMCLLQCWFSFVILLYIAASVVGESTYTYITVSLIPMFFISATLFDGTIVLTEWTKLRTAPSARRTLSTIEQSPLSPSEEYNVSQS